ncbi:MAG: M12 family metallo-peptidase, partial [Bacteroidota bacterium]
MKKLYQYLGFAWLLLLATGPLKAYNKWKNCPDEVAPGDITIDLAIAADYSLYAHYGQEQLFNYLGILADVAVDNFNDEFNQPIRVRIVEILVVTCSSCEPWSLTNNVDSLLQNFAMWANDGGFNNDYDLAQLWTRRDLATVDGVAVYGLAEGILECEAKSHSLILDFSSSLLETITNFSHELGHHFGAEDDYSPGLIECAEDEGSLIMQPSPNTAFNWSDMIGNCTMNSKASINTWLEETCFTAEETTECAAISQLSLTTSTEGDSLFLSWTGIGASSSYLVEILDQTENATKSYLADEENYLLVIAPEEYCHDWRITVKPKCQEGVAEGRSILIRTDCSTLAGLIYREDFSLPCGTLPVGWEVREVGNINWSFESNMPTDEAHPISGFVADCYASCGEGASILPGWEFRRAELISPIIDLANFPSPELWFRYYLRPELGFGPGAFYVEAFNGSNWERIYTDVEGTKCLVHEGRCSKGLSIDLHDFRHSQFQMRFVYENIGRQDGFVALDILMVVETLNEFDFGSEANSRNLLHWTNQVNRTKVTVYPNPTIDKVFVENLTTGTPYRLLD